MRLYAYLAPLALLLTSSSFAKDQLTFSQTQTFAPKYLKLTAETPKVLPADWQNHVKIPSPPKNDSATTREELRYLNRLQQSRSSEDVANIKRELEVPGFSLGSYQIAEIYNFETNPATAHLLRTFHREIAIVIFTLKKTHDRVRPSFLDSEIRPCIKIPDHPAYPSGHATEAFGLALVLEQIDPDQKDDFGRDAAQIGKNREIAGVHYPSDTAAGQLVARQAVNLMLKNREFQRILKLAKQELAQNR